MTNAAQLPQEKGRQFADNVADRSAEEIHEHHQWHPFGDLGFADAYCKVKANFLLRFRCGDRQEFIASFQRDWRKDVFGDEIWESLTRLQEKSFWEATCSRKFLSWAEGAQRIYNAHGQEQTVLVDNVELVELPEKNVASLVWTDTVENFESILPYGWYNSIQHGFVTLGRVSDWEFRVGSDDWDKPASEIIEGATQTIESVAKDQWNLSGNGWNFADVIAELSRLQIGLRKSGDGISIVKPPQSRLEFIDVLFGPIQSF
jgi:hypothetical protein